MTGSARSGKARGQTTLSKKILASVISFLLTVGTLEVLARVLFDGTPAVLLRSPLDSPNNVLWPHFFRTHPELFWELRPNLDLPFDRIGDRTDSRGFRNAAEIGEKTSVPRILCLGDSCTYGLGVAIADVWPTVLAREHGHDVINAGTPGYTTYQALRLFEDRCRDLEQDVIVLEFGANDVLPWGTPQGDGFYGLSDRERAKHSRYLFRRRHSRLLEWIESLSLPAPKDLRGVIPADAGPRVPIEEFRENLLLLASRAPRSVLLVWSLRRQLSLDRDLGPITGTMQGFPFTRFVAYQEVMRGLQSPERAVLDVGKVFLESGHDPVSLFHDSIHPSKLGHRVLAKALHEVLRELE
ncbi:MAG: SGNH/GDSL hydrolase family protein [Planctomycetota bacterium]